MTKSALARVLAQSLMAAGPSAGEVAAQAALTLGRPWRWLGPMARRYVTAQEGAIRFRHREVVRFLLDDPGFQAHSRRLRIATWLHSPAQMQPVPAAGGWDIPAIPTAGDLARWLGVHPGELEWFANLKALGSGRLEHYHYLKIEKSPGRVRIIEAPKRELKELQRWVLREILQKVPSHPAAYGFVKGRSVGGFVAPHVGKRAVLKMDLRDFFPSIPGARIQAVFRTLGYPETVADLLGGICTNVVRGDVPDVYRRPHLPQGAPSSPMLANICAYRMDCRLAGLAKGVGAEYTRYADDLAFSGDLDFNRLSTYIAAIAHEEGFSVNFRKTRVMRQGVRQRLAGLSANQKVNVIREDFDRLKAILTNCVRIGPASQNRENHSDFRAHLDGPGRVCGIDQHPERASATPDSGKNRVD